MADVDPLNRKVQTHSSRRAARDSLFLSATIRKPGAPETGASEQGSEPVRVRNLSAVGMMADHNGVSLPGEAVVVTLRGIGAVAGKVAWVRNGRIGIAFDVEVDPKLARKPVKPAAKPAAPKPLRPLF